MENFEFERKKKRKLKKEPIYILACILCLVAGVCIGYVYQLDKLPFVNKNQANIYEEVGEVIENDFLDTTDSKTSIEERMINGMIAALQDPHTSYLSSQDAVDLGTSINGSFHGIGVTFITIDAGGLIMDVYDNTPAAKAGLQQGDIITHIEGTSVAGYSSDKIKSTIQGEEGTEVSLRILRNGKSQDITCTRGSVESSVSYNIDTKNQVKCGYLKITTFGDSSADFIEKALQAFEAENIENIVIDLRGNGGGYLDAAKDILNLFLPEGSIMFKVQDKNKNEKVYKASKHKKYMFNQGYILVDHNSASASEVMTAALKEDLGYKVIGETTYGKGTAQVQHTLSNSSVIKYTNAKWLTPQDTWINGKGIEPDYPIDMTTINDFRIGEMEKEYKYDQVDNNILYMQEMLKELGYKVDREDGYFSKATQEALKAFEKDYGLTVNGIYEKNDATILLSALTYHVYHLEDKVYQKAIELMK